MKEEYNDYELISYVNDNDEEAKNIIIKKYEPLISSLATRFLKSCPYLGIEKGDLIQEGMIGLNHAIDYFNEQKDITFYTYAKKCVERRLISAIVAANRLKHKNLNESISFDTEEDGTLDYFLKDDSTNPEKIVIDESQLSEIIVNIKAKLTDFEEQVFNLMLSAFSYREIAKILDKEPKQVDNAIQRIKNKVREEIRINDGK